MYPTAIARQAAARKLDVVAICDHNASENVPYVIRAARGQGVTILPGMEITSSEEAHLLAIFDNMENLQRLQEVVYSRMSGQNDENRFGCQAIVNESDEVEGFNPRLLIGATEMALAELVQQVHFFGGVAIASHVDRESFSVISQLGFIDPEIPFDALEISRRTSLAQARRSYPDLARYPFVTSSDAHRIEEIGKAFTEIWMEEPSVRDLKMAFAGQEGRRLAGC